MPQNVSVQQQHKQTTFMMQEFIRRYYSDRLDREAEGKKVGVPHVYTIPQATPTPSHVLLVNDFVARFSLRPYRGMPLQELNQSLDEFYNQYATKDMVADWLDKHPFQEAVADDAYEIWMAT
ncbi:hypothetical protein F5Y18DRAFT_426513 [Xylariaceae sp. FL1019]|nr:hypothetical protein F5Y18DRAFT_426513 [Xylariaceae sp. FL1019]